MNRLEKTWKALSTYLSAAQRTTLPPELASQVGLPANKTVDSDEMQQAVKELGRSARNTSNELLLKAADEEKRAAAA